MDDVEDDEEEEFEEDEVDGRSKTRSRKSSRIVVIFDNGIICMQIYACFSYQGYISRLKNSDYYCCFEAVAFPFVCH